MAILKQSTTYTRAFLLVESADHITGLTGATATVNLSKAGGAFAAAGGTVTEIANGWYKIALTTTDTGTLGDLAFHITATSADPTDFVDQVTVDIPGGSVSSVTGAVASVTAGVTVTTNNDKTGYSLTQTFPTNFSSLAITAGGAVTAGTVSDKTGYSLSQSFPSNFSLLAIDGSGDVTYNNSAPPSAATIASAVFTTGMTEAYSTKGSTLTLANFAYEATQMLTEFSISGTTITTKKRDQSTTAETFTLNDATSPTSLTRAT